MAQKSFSANSVELLRTKLLGILESYANPWDLLAELAQNSMDSIRQLKGEKGHIEIIVDHKKSQVTFRDNGVGIPPNNSEDLFRPFGTSKRGDSSTIGEKGIGLKFVIFTSNKFMLSSSHLDGGLTVNCDGANRWLNDDNSSEILFDYEEVKAKETTGVETVIELADKNHPLLKLTPKQFEFVLRTKTAIGSTAHIWGKPENCDCSVIFKMPSGKKKSIEFECNYLLPSDGTTKKISLTAYNEWREGHDPDDAAKRARLKDKVIFNNDSSVVGGQEVNFWTCMMPSRDQWKAQAVASGLVELEEKEEFNTIDHFYAHNFGVYLSTKNMPTAVEIGLSAKGEAGYTKNFFAIIEDPRISFDIGRKSPHGNTWTPLRRQAQKEFNQYIKLKRFLRGEAIDKADYHSREELIGEVLKLPDLKSDNTNFLKRPNRQEAVVAAMFYEQMGKGKFDGFEAYTTGYRDKYDLSGKVDHKNFVIEFKYDLKGLIKDFGSITKLFNEINVLVLWSVDDIGIADLNRANIDINKVDEDDATRFPIVHYKLSVPHTADIEVVEIKRMIDP